MDQAQRRADGTFAKGISGNPQGRRKREVRQDGYVNAFMGHGTTRDRRTATRHYTRVVSDLEAIDLRRGNWLARRICNLLDADSFRRAYELKLDDKETSETVMTAIETLGINKRAMEAGQMERCAGGAALFPVLDGALGDLSTPLALDDGPSRIGKIMAIHLLEPRELVPVDWYGDISNPKFRKPSHYRLWPLSGGGTRFAGMQVIHESRLAIYPGLKFTEEPLPGQRLGWGDSVLTESAEAIADHGLTWGSAATILHNFSQRIVKYKGLMDMLREEGGEALIQKRVAMMDMVANALRALPLDADDDLVSVSTTVAGFADMLRECNQLVSAIADMPMTRLFKMSPAGLNATGESDMEGWYESVGIRQKDHTCNVEWLIRLLLMSADGPTNGNEPDVWSIEWLPMKTPSEKETSETRKLDSEADKNWVEMGAASPDDIANSHWKGDTYSRDLVIDWVARKKQQAIDQQNAADLQAAELEAMGRGPTNGQTAKPVAPTEGD